MWRLEYLEWDDDVPWREENKHTIRVPLDQSYGPAHWYDAARDAQKLWRERLAKGTKMRFRYMFIGEESEWPCEPKLIYEVPLENP